MRVWKPIKVWNMFGLLVDHDEDQLDRVERDQAHEGPSGMIFDWDELLALAAFFFPLVPYDQI